MKKAVVIIFSILFGIADALLLLAIIVLAIINIFAWGFGKEKEKSLNGYEIQSEGKSDFDTMIISGNREEYLVSFTKEV